MQKNRRLSECLPISFADGTQVRQFSKPCLRCNHMLNAKQMFGIARMLDNHIVIAARAHCPSCNADFPVTCVINSEKQVQRVIVPYFLFNPYLRLIPMQEGERIVVAPRPEDAESSEPVPPSPPVASLDVVRAEEAIGQYAGQPIPAWVQVNGQQYAFERIAPDARTQQGEFLLDGHLVYRSI